MKTNEQKLREFFFPQKSVVSVVMVGVLTNVSLARVVKAKKKEVQVEKCD